MSSLYLLWDESHLWGLIAWRALKAFGLPFELVKGQDIAQGLLSRKRPAVLLVPGGTARRKAERLGPAGKAAIQEYVRGGGVYMGFCGGTGLALSGDDGLGLCPWTRAGFANRMLHMVSGHMRVSVNTGHHLTPGDFSAQALLPVWWPARFAATADNSVEVLATYETPGEDFWVADLPLANLPQGTFSGWEDLYGLELRPSHMSGSPCLITGEYGHGHYVLSYAHLETPGSGQANRWLAHMLEIFSKLKVETTVVPAWDLRRLPVAWEDKVLARAVEVLEEILRLGMSHFLLFERNPWLFGWRAGIPGASLNHLHGLIRQASAQAPTPAAQQFWQDAREQFGQVLEHFREGVLGYLLAERLAMTLSSTLPDVVSRKGLKDQREALFGPAMAHGGLYGDMVETLEELVYRQLTLEQF